MGDFRLGRPATYTDDEILYAIDRGNNTPNKLLVFLNLRSKTTLIKRLRRMRDDGLVTLIERTRREGFTVMRNPYADDVTFNDCRDDGGTYA